MAYRTDQIKSFSTRPECRCSPHHSFKKPWTHNTYFAKPSLASDKLSHQASLKFYSSRTRLFTIWHHRTFAIYVYLTFHLGSYMHLSSKNLLSIPHFNLRTYGARSFSVAAPHSGILCRLTLRIAPRYPFLKTDLKLSFLKNIFLTF